MARTVGSSTPGRPALGVLAVAVVTLLAVACDEPWNSAPATPRLRTSSGGTTRFWGGLTRGSRARGARSSWIRTRPRRG